VFNYLTAFYYFSLPKPITTINLLNNFQHAYKIWKKNTYIFSLSNTVHWFEFVHRCMYVLKCALFSKTLQIYRYSTEYRTTVRKSVCFEHETAVDTVCSYQRIWYYMHAIFTYTLSLMKYIKYQIIQIRLVTLTWVPDCVCIAIDKLCAKTYIASCCYRLIFQMQQRQIVKALKLFALNSSSKLKSKLTYYFSPK